MPHHSPFPDLVLPRTNILTYLFSSEAEIATRPLWIDAQNSAHTLSPAQLLDLVRKTAASFRRLGIMPGDVIPVLSPNHIYMPVLFLATVGYGAIFTGFNPAYTVQELVHLVKDSEAKALFVHPTLIKKATAAADEAGLPKNRIFSFSDSTKQTETVEGLRDWRELIATATESDVWKWPEYSPEEASKQIATINYSSGTTGLPKGVMVTHSNIIANLEQTMFIRYHMTPTNREAERWVGFLPLYHAYGQLYTILMACKLQIPVYVMESFHYEKFLGVIQKYRITNLQIAPPILIMLDKRPETLSYDLSSLREVVCGAAPVPLELQRRIAVRFGVKFTLGWGMTELTCTGTSIPGGMVETTGSVGFLLPNTLGKLVDDDGREVAVGQRGEILIKGPNMCLGYWRNPSATTDLFDDEGWLRTGDIAVYNEDGLLWIVDRKKELIKVNALQVAPAEIEAKLLENPQISDAAAVGITLQGSEWPRAYVVPQPDFVEKLSELDVERWIEGHLAKHKWLKGGVSFVQEVPKLASGKIQRKVLREWAQRDAERMDGTTPAAKVRAKL